MAEISEQIKDNVNIEDPLTRIAVAAFISVFTTFAILWVMQILIATGKGAISSKYEGRFVDFVRIKKDEDLNTKNAKPKKPPEPEEPPPDTPQELDDIDTTADTVNIGAVDANVGVGAGIGGFNAGIGRTVSLATVRTTPRAGRSGASCRTPYASGILRGDQIRDAKTLHHKLDILGTDIEPFVIFQIRSIANSNEFSILIH